MRLKVKFYMNVVGPTILYGTECWAVNNKMEKRMLRWMSEMTKDDSIMNEYVT